MSAAHLVSNIIDKHLKSKRIGCNDKETNLILQNIVITGGCPRDILLQKPINDVDIMIDTFKLTQIQTTIASTEFLKLDATFFADIIIQSTELKEVILMNKSDRAYQLTLIKDIYYNNINLKGQEIDILNPYQRDWNNRFLEKKQT
eukprot:309470_1